MEGAGGGGVKQVLERGPEQRESKMTVLCLLITTILISYIIYYIIIELLNYLLWKNIPAETGNGTTLLYQCLKNQWNITH